MRTLVIILLFFTTNTFAISQNSHLNCIIFVDGKLPEDSKIFNSYFSYNDSLDTEIKLSFKYIIGEFSVNRFKYVCVKKNQGR